MYTQNVSPNTRETDSTPADITVSVIDFNHDRESLALHLASTLWAGSGISDLEQKAREVAHRLSNSGYVDISLRANLLIDSTSV